MGWPCPGSVAPELDERSAITTPPAPRSGHRARTPGRLPGRRPRPRPPRGPRVRPPSRRGRGRGKRTRAHAHQELQLAERLLDQPDLLAVAGEGAVAQRGPRPRAVGGG